jgi:hypothetical protein
MTARADTTADNRSRDHGREQEQRPQMTARADTTTYIRQQKAEQTTGAETTASS